MAIAAAVVAVAGTVLSAYGQWKAGKAQQAAADIEARRLRAKAGETRAVSQRAALEEARQGRLVQSRALAVAASGGGGATDPTVVNLMAKLAGETQYRKMTRLYEGEMAAQSLEEEAKATKKGGRIASTSANIGAAGSALSSGASLYSRYGGK